MKINMFLCNSKSTNVIFLDYDMHSTVLLLRLDIRETISQRKDSSLHDFGLWFEWVPKQTSRVWNNNTIPHMLRPHRGEGGMTRDTC
jgi:hypothetical protein